MNVSKKNLKQLGNATFHSSSLHRTTVMNYELVPAAGQWLQCSISNLSSETVAICRPSWLKDTLRT